MTQTSTRSVLSMTGFGTGRHEWAQGAYAVEVRAVNHRFLKLSLRLPPRLQAFEAEVEALVRKTVTRGALNLNVREELQTGAANAKGAVDHEALVAWRDALRSAANAAALPHPKEEDFLVHLLRLPGVLRETGTETDQAEDRQLLLAAVSEALAALADSRAREGDDLVRILREQAERLTAHLAEVKALAPEVPRRLRDRMRTRVENLLSEAMPGQTVSEGDLLRELSVLADKTDITEEIDRLESHLGRLDEILTAGGAVGRRLDFLTQELLREVNTIGSKASDGAIAHAVVEMKVEVERMKEQVQNLE